MRTEEDTQPIEESGWLASSEGLIEDRTAIKPTPRRAHELSDDDSTQRAYARSNSQVIPPVRRGRRWGLILTAILGVGILLALAGVAYATYDFGKDHDGKILPGATIAGVDVGGMSRQEALAAVKEAVEPELDRTFTVRFGEREWKVTPRELGARSNARRAVASALAASDDVGFKELAEMRWLDQDLDFDGDVAVSYPRKGAKEFIAGLAGEVQRPARDAELDYSTGWVKIRKERSGYELRQPKSVASMMGALTKGGNGADLSVNEVKPAVTAADFDQVLLVRQSERKLYLYENGKIKQSWPVAVGLPQYPTPTGVFEVELLRNMPTWINPQPDGWGKNMPAEIPPGPGNPLGVRAINWTAAGIRFHGTENIASIGTAASHGCVRMTNEDVVELYDQVEVGSPIVSIY